MGLAALRRLAAYAWALPTTLAGLALALLAGCTGARAHWRAGALEVAGGRLRVSRRIDAITLGHVILGRSHARLDALRVHEQVHVRQCERWGPLFGPAYLAASAWQWLRGRDAYRDNPFERAAFAAERQARGAAAPPQSPSASSPG